MGRNAERVQEYLVERLGEHVPEVEWETERGVGETRVDVGGTAETGELCLVEVEWRRADPADNAAKVFRHTTETIERRTYVFQVFTRYYELADEGVSSKRKNAEFVGGVAEDALGSLSYSAVSLDVEPPKRGSEIPDGWRSDVDAVAQRIGRILGE